MISGYFCGNCRDMATLDYDRPSAHPLRHLETRTSGRVLGQGGLHSAESQEFQSKICSYNGNPDSKYLYTKYMCVVKYIKAYQDKNNSN